MLKNLVDFWKFWEDRNDLQRKAYDIKNQKTPLWPYFSTNPTFKLPLKNPTSYLVEAGFWEKPTSQNPT